MVALHFKVVMTATGPKYFNFWITYFLCNTGISTGILCSIFPEFRGSFRNSAEVKTNSKKIPNFEELQNHFCGLPEVGTLSV
jgi:hypothetical protein